MPAATDRPKWILRCRDLVQLYYGVRMVAAIIENQPLFAVSAPAELLTKDPRRIRYEIVIANQTASAITVQVGTQAQVQNQNGPFYQLAPNATQVIDRNFLTDLDAVTDNVWIFANVADYACSTRETFLTPLPADET